MYCIFCHKEVQFRKACPTCRSGFVRWVNEHTNIKSALAVHKVLALVPFSTTPLPKHAGRKWPGFYTGDSVWTKPEHYYITDQDVNWETEGTALTNLLQCQGINLIQN